MDEFGFLISFEPSIGYDWLFSSIENIDEIKERKWPLCHVPSNEQELDEWSLECSSIGLRFDFPYELEKQNECFERMCVFLEYFYSKGVKVLDLQMDDCKITDTQLFQRFVTIYRKNSQLPGNLLTFAIRGCDFTKVSQEIFEEFTRLLKVKRLHISECILDYEIFFGNCNLPKNITSIYLYFECLENTALSHIRSLLFWVSCKDFTLIFQENCFIGDEIKENAIHKMLSIFLGIGFNENLHNVKIIAPDLFNYTLPYDSLSFGFSRIFLNGLVKNIDLTDNRMDKARCISLLKESMEHGKKFTNCKIKIRKQNKRGAPLKLPFSNTY